MIEPFEVAGRSGVDTRPDPHFEAMREANDIEARMESLERQATMLKARYPELARSPRLDPWEQKFFNELTTRCNRVLSVSRRRRCRKPARRPGARCRDCALRERFRMLFAYALLTAAGVAAASFLG